MDRMFADNKLRCCPIVYYLAFLFTLCQAPPLEAQHSYPASRTFASTMATDVQYTSSRQFLPLLEPGPNGSPLPRSFLMAQSTRSGRSQPKLVLPSSPVQLGAEFQVQVENAQGVAVWTYDKSRLKLIGSKEFTASFKAIAVGKAEIRANSQTGLAKDVVVVVKQHTTKPIPLDLTPKSKKAIELLEQYRAGMDPLAFFNKMAGLELTVKDLSEAKADLMEAERQRLIKDEGVDPREAIIQAKDFWEREYASSERDLMEARQKGVENAWKFALAEYVRLHGTFPYVAAKMDVGTWATASKATLYFGGDIDFSILMVDVEDAKELRQLFVDELVKSFNLDMKSLDAIGTVHHAATSDVYIGEYGSRFAELDNVMRGKLFKLRVVNGKAVAEEVASADEKVKIYAQCDNKKNGILEKSRSEGDYRSKVDMEPGLSLELLRHLTTDAITPDYSPLEKVIKICKYAARSIQENESLRLGQDFKFAVEQIMKIRNSGAQTPQEDARNAAAIMERAAIILGANWAAHPGESLDKFGEKTVAILRANIADGVNARMKRIGELKDRPKELEVEQEKLLTELEDEYKVYEKDGVEFPPRAMEVLEELRSRKGRVKLAADEVKKMAEAIKKAIDSPNASRLMVALVWEGLKKTHETADKTIDGFNQVLDVMDNASIEKLRGYQIIEIETRQGKSRIKTPISINTINSQLNETILGKVGDSVTFKGMNLAVEGYAYWEAYSNAPDWKEGMKNVAWEFFNRRAPGVQAVDAYYQEDYFRTGREVVYTLFPPLAIPEGLYGLAASGAEWGAGKFDRMRYDEMVDALYKGVEWTKGKPWKVVGITYDCEEKGRKQVSKDDLLSLVDLCPEIQRILYVEVKQHPVLVRFEEMLENKAVSSGRTSWVRYPYYYDGLGKYGQELQKQYHAKVDKVVKEYLVILIDELEKRKTFEEGSGPEELKKLQDKLGCAVPLMQLSGNAKADRKAIEELVKAVDRIDQANDYIKKLKEDWKADFLQTYEPECLAESIRDTAEKADLAAENLKKAQQKAYADVMQIVGKDQCNKENLGPATLARLHMSLYDPNSGEYGYWYETYQQALDDLRKKLVGLAVTINGPENVCVTQNVFMSAEYNIGDCPNCTAHWWVEDKEAGAEEIAGGTVKGAGWIPLLPGRKVIYVKVTQARTGREAVGRKPVNVLEEKNCPRLQIALDAASREISAGDELVVTAVPISLGPDNVPFNWFLWSEDRKKPEGSSSSTYTVSARGRKAGEKIKVGVVARTEYNAQVEDSITLTVVSKSSVDMPVEIAPADREIRDDEKITFSAEAKPRRSGTTLRYQWSLDGKPVGEEKKTFTLFGGELAPGKTVTLGVVVLEVGSGGKMASSGNRTIKMYVKPSTGLNLVLDHYPRTVKDNEPLRICVKEPISKAPGKYTYAYSEWLGRYWSDSAYPFQSGDGDYGNCLKLATSGKAGQTIKLKIQVRDDQGRMAEKETGAIKVVEADEEPRLQVLISPSRATIAEDADIELACTAIPLPDSGRLSFNGVWNDEGSSSARFRFSGKGYRDQTVPVTVEVSDEKGRRGEATAWIYVKKKPADIPAGTTTIPVVTTSTIVTTSSTSTTSTTSVLPDTVKPDDVVKEPPACTYEYTDWGECSRESQKQTRSVRGISPKGCVQKVKPVLEQGCTPPPTEEEKRNNYFNCLCRCYSGWAGHIGVWYDPEEKVTPECKSSGPCIGGIGSWGCTRRHFFGAPNDCAKGCYEGAYGKGTYDEKKADSLRKDANKKHKKPMTLKITPSKNPIEFGDIVTLTAEVSEGTGGYRYEWGGCAQDAKDATAKVVNSRQCRNCVATLTVTDQEGAGIKDSVTIQCAALTVKLTKEKPKEDSIPVGGTATFNAEVFAGGKPASGTLFYVWERNPDAIFGDPKNPTYETQGGSQYRHTATFRKSGVTPVWVSVLKVIDGKKTTVGESQQIQINVVNPQLNITVVPQQPRVGQEVKLEVRSLPAMGDDMIGYFWDIPGYFSGTGDKASFKPKDDKPIKARVTAKTKDGGDEVGSKEVTITAQGYQVTLGEPRYLESPPQLWKCDTQLGQAQKCGMVTVKPNEFAVFRNISLQATVNPAPESPRYKWTVDPSGSCGLPGGGREITLNCSNTGTYTVKVEVTNADGAILGSASQSVNISISQKDMDNSKQAKDAYDKLQKAKELVPQGKLDEGLSLVAEAAVLDPKNAEAKTLADKWKNEKQTVMQHVESCKKLLGENKLVEAQKELDVAIKLHPKYQPVIEAGDLLKKKQEEAKTKADKDKETQEKLRKEGEALESQKKLPEAIAKYQESLKYLPDAALADHVKALQAKLEKEKQEAGNREKARKLREEGAALQQQGKLAEAIAKYQESLKYVPDANLEAHIRTLQARLEKEKQEAGNKEKARKLREEGAAMQKQEKLAQAIGKYQESLKYVPDANLEAHIRTLQAKLDKEKQEAGNRERARKLREEGIALQQQGKLAQAIGKYRESLKYVPDANLEAHIRTLQAKLDKEKKEAGNRGYQLYFDGKLVSGPDAAQYSFEQARQNCTSNMQSKPGIGIRCVYDGKTFAERPASRTTTPGARSFDGSYVGTFSGESTGNIQFTVKNNKVSGKISGNYKGDPVNGEFSGSIDPNGNIHSTLSGSLTDSSSQKRTRYPFGGSVDGRIGGATASGNWMGKSQWGNPSGQWSASKR